MNSLKKIVIIPARMDSKRFPGKPLVMSGGKTLLEWTYDRAKSSEAEVVLVTSPDREIAHYCQDKGMLFYPSSEEIPNGTVRCADVALRMEKRIGKDFLLVNWQVDEPCVPPEYVNELMELTEQSVLFGESEFVFTITSPPVKPITDYDENTVKAIVSNDVCLWFSRAPMAGAHLHCGVYAYSFSLLKQLGRMKPSRFAEAESLEQLTWIEFGIEVRSVTQPIHPLSINTLSDWEVFDDSMA